MISRSRGSIGARAMPDGLDSGRCHLGDGLEGAVRINLDGIWTVLCLAHRDQLLHDLLRPEPAPTQSGGSAPARPDDITDWQYEVANGDTRLSFEQWLENQETY